MLHDERGSAVLLRLADDGDSGPVVPFGAPRDAVGGPADSRFRADQSSYFRVGRGERDPCAHQIGHVLGGGSAHARAEAPVGLLAGDTSATVLFVGNGDGLCPPAHVVDDPVKLGEQLGGDGVVIEFVGTDTIHVVQPAGPGPPGCRLNGLDAGR